MTLEELRERIKNEVVLYEGELADWQWRQKGLVAEANELGITDFTRLVNDISRQINRDFGKILDLKKKIVTVALQRQNKLTAADITQFVLEAERVQLSRAFVMDQWIPAIQSGLPDAPSPVETVPDPVFSAPATTPPVPVLPEAPPVVDPVESVRKKIKSILDDYDKHIQAQSLKFLFKAIDYDETLLAEEIRRYLSEHYYASVHPPKGNTLKEKLISTDWRHLSWWEKEPSKPVEAVRNTVSTPNVNAPTNLPPVPQWQAPPPVQSPEPAKKSGLSDAALIGLAVLSALILIWVVLRMARGEEEPEPDRKPAKKQSGQLPKSSRNREKAVTMSVQPDGEKKAEENGMILTDQELIGSAKIETDPSVKNRLDSDSKTKVDFDEVDEQTGEFGFRPARKGTLWGYIDASNRWVITPQFDLASPFNNGKASVEMDGIQFFIDRYGIRIRDDN